MRTKSYEENTLEALFELQKIATMPELKSALGTDVTMTVFRKLKKLDYRTSYSHRGSFYTLDEIAQFNRQGLWSYADVHFSAHGSLKATAKKFVIDSESGYTVAALRSSLGTEVKKTLLNLYKSGELSRSKIAGRYVYFSSQPTACKQQKLKRETHAPAWSAWAEANASLRVSEDELKAAVILYYSLLDEKQRRLYAGLESMRLGHGGDQKIGVLFNIAPHTVSKGRRELMGGFIENRRIRKPGGGRKPIEKKNRT
jgi:hypothetical protein